MKADGRSGLAVTDFVDRSKWVEARRSVTRERMCVGVRLDSNSRKNANESEMIHYNGQYDYQRGGSGLRGLLMDTEDINEKFYFGRPDVIFFGVRKMLHSNSLQK